MFKLLFAKRLLLASLPFCSIDAPKLPPYFSPKTPLHILAIDKVPDEARFECYPDFATDEIFVRCQWNDEPTVLYFDFHDSEQKRTYKLRRSVSKGVQTIRFDIKHFSPGPYYIFVGTDSWNKVLDAGFVKVIHSK